MGDRFFDLGNLSVNNGLAEDDDARLLTAYFGRAPTAGRGGVAVAHAPHVRPAGGDVGAAAGRALAAGLRLRRLRAPSTSPAWPQGARDPRLEDWLRCRGRVSCPSRARVVIVGGGVGGTAIAYWLAQLGERDVVLLDRAELTSGSTFHSAGLVGPAARLGLADADDDGQRRALPAAGGRVGVRPRLGGVRRPAPGLHAASARRSCTARSAWAQTFGLPLELLSARRGAASSSRS